MLSSPPLALLAKIPEDYRIPKSGRTEAVPISKPREQPVEPMRNNAQTDGNTLQRGITAAPLKVLLVTNTTETGLEWHRPCNLIGKHSFVGDYSGRHPESNHQPPSSTGAIAQQLYHSILLTSSPGGPFTNQTGPSLLRGYHNSGPGRRLGIFWFRLQAPVGNPASSMNSGKSSDWARFGGENFVLLFFQ
uniref:Uncharacterized protein n=1 Tax=Ditylenchus dipsaci TaxID=166011 RepID=A0A915DSN0_9BILA